MNGRVLRQIPYTCTIDPPGGHILRKLKSLHRFFSVALIGDNFLLTHYICLSLNRFLYLYFPGMIISHLSDSQKLPRLTTDGLQSAPTYDLGSHYQRSPLQAPSDAALGG